jgi:FkbM family methyltransferase
MTRIVRRAALVAMLLLLLAAGTAYPECTWVLWAEGESPPGSAPAAAPRSPRVDRVGRGQLRRTARNVAQSALAGVLRVPGGLRVVNRLHQALSPSQKRHFFYLSADLSCRVEGPWTVDFAGRRLVLPLHHDFDLAWLAATAFHGYDTEVHELYEALVRAPRPPRVFFDVGANYGLHSLKLLAHGVRVISFEPNPACQSFFTECCRRNGLHHDLRLVAVGDRTGRAELRVPRGRTWLGTTAREVAEGWARDVEVEILHVPQVTLDEVVETDGIIPDVIKIDTEGTELAVLEGTRAILEDTRPMLVLESWPGTPGRPALFELLAAYSYGLHALRFATPPSTALTVAAFVDSSATNFTAIPSTTKLSE